MWGRLRWRVWFGGLVVGLLLVRQFVGWTPTLHPQPSRLLKLQELAGSTQPLVVVVLGTRPEAIKLAPVILEFGKVKSEVRCFVLSTGQHDTMFRQALRVFGLEQAIGLSLDVMRPGQSLNALTARMVTELGEAFEVCRPTVVIVQGDTTTAFVAALAAFHLQIPVAHVEAGLRTRQLYSPFPEEFNRVAISSVASIHFAATPWAARQLLRECKHPDSILVTGNTVVDALHLVLRINTAGATVRHILTTAKERTAGNGNGRLQMVLLTIHRRENLGAPIHRVLVAVMEILRAHPNVVVVYPFHLNPHVQSVVRSILPSSVLQGTTTPDDQPLHRLLVRPPFDYEDSVAVLNHSVLVLTDSGGIQEEAVSLGKPVLVLRDSTERPEGVLAGIATLVGTRTSSLVGNATKLLKALQKVGGGAVMEMNVSQGVGVYGDGRAASRIVGAVRDRIRLFQKHTSGVSGESKVEGDKMGQQQTGAQFWAPLPNSGCPPPHEEEALPPEPFMVMRSFDVIVVLTVWKRSLLQRQLELISTQSILSNHSVNIIIFQNGNHTTVAASTVEDWQAHHEERWGPAAKTVELTFIHSTLETGYFGRFLTPLLTTLGPGNSNPYFVLCDDDVVWGRRYFENLFRVVDSGYLATRNGRFVLDGRNLSVADWWTWVGRPKDVPEWGGCSERGYHSELQVTTDKDVLYDYGGHIWSGRLNWLREVWKHPPPLLTSSEDFWLSAVLKVKLGIRTRKPRCPTPGKEDVNKTLPDFCACSTKDAVKHVHATLGGGVFNDRSDRFHAIRTIRAAFNHTLALDENPNVIEEECAAHTIHREWVYKVEGTPFEDCLWWT